MTVTLILSALLIFAMRLADVSIGTVRLIVLVRGQTLLAAVLSFFSALIWILATAQVINDLQEPIKIVAYAAGFAVGTLVGALIERWIATVATSWCASPTQPRTTPASCSWVRSRNAGRRPHRAVDRDWQQAGARRHASVHTPSGRSRSRSGLLRNRTQCRRA